MTAKPSYEELERRVQELEKIESELEYSKEMLRGYEKASLGYQSLDENGHYITVNQTWLDTLGYTIEEVIGKSFADFIHPDWRHHFKENFPRFKSIGEILGAEFEMVKKNGDLILVSLTGKISRDHKDDFQQTHCIFHDITERKRAEDALNEKTQLLQNITDNMFDLVSLTDMKGNFTFLGASHKILKYDLDSLIGKNVLEFVHPEDLPEISSAFNDFLFSLDDNQKVEYRYRCADGTYIWLETVGRFIKDDKGNPKEILFSSRDVTGRKRTEKELVKEATRRRILMEQSGDGIVILDQTGQLIESNQRFADMLGYPFESMCQLKVFDWEFHHPPDRIIEMINSVDEKRDHFETKHRRRDGSIYDVEISSNAAWFEGQKLIFCICRDITERKQAEEALKSNYALLHIAGETAIFGGWSVDLERNICTWSDAVADIHDVPHGYAPPVQVAINFYAPEWREKITHIFSACAKDGIPYDEEMEIITQNGKRGWVRTTGKAVKNEKDKIIKVQGSFQDITERKQAEEKLAHSHKLMHYIIEHTNSAVAVHDRNMHYIYVSQRYLDDYKVNENDIIGKHHYDVFPDLPMKWRTVHQKALAGEISKADRDPYFRDDGTIEWTRWECRPWYEEDGSIGGIIVYTEVITDWINAEEKLRSSHERMLTILNSIDSTVYVADMDTGEILFMNKRMITDFGGDKTGDICYSAFKKNSEPCEWCTNDQLVDKHGNPAGICIWNEKNPVTGRYYINYDRAIEWTDGRLVRMQIATDITDLKKMEAQLAQAQKMETVGRLAGGVAHDFNNMLGVILGHTELALLRTDDKHKLCSDLKEIQNAAMRSADITKQLLAFARKQTISPRQLDLNDTVESLLNMLRRLIGENIDLLWQPAAHIWPVKMDPSQIDQILANLCINARDAISGVGKLTIETGRKSFDEEYCSDHPGFIPGDFILLAVSDNGCGMDKDTLDNLFEPFFTTKEVGKGTGLGLATIYGIVKQNSGFINVYSEPGQGSTFKIYLPRLIVDEDTDKAVPEKKAAAGGTETILLVEDEPTILRMTRMMLERKGYTVISAATPAEAVEKAKIHSGAIDLLMTDVVMPGMNGRDLAGKITALYPGIRLLFMSGYTANVIAHQGILDKGVAFIQKPFSMADLTEKLREILDTASDKN